MNERDRLLNSIATIINDYQAGNIPTPTASHVERWINQFSESTQQPILTELEHVLEKTYFSKIRIKKFLKSLIHHINWTGENATAFWLQMNFLNLQPRGNSQRELIALFDSILQSELNISVSQCGNSTKYIYIDDGLFSGGRIKSDLKHWISQEAPPNSELYIAVIALHTQGFYFTKKELNEENAKSGKNIKIKYGKLITIEDGIFNCNTSDVLRPTDPGNDPDVNAYVNQLDRKQTWRTGTNVGPRKFFSSNQGRTLLEQEFLKKGIAVRDMCYNFNDYQRPLGNTTMRTVGFGTMFATYRNCPNNAPLVLWAGNPWYPLLPRVTN